MTALGRLRTFSALLSVATSLAACNAVLGIEEYGPGAEDSGMDGVSSTTDGTIALDAEQEAQGDSTSSDVSTRGDVLGADSGVDGTLEAETQEASAVDQETSAADVRESAAIDSTAEGAPTVDAPPDVPSCPSGEILCGGACVNPTTSQTYCGATGDCQGPSAGTPCSGAGAVCCGGACIDSLTNDTYCGAGAGCSPPGTTCPGNMTCSNGACACGMGLVDCGGNCIDPTTNEQYCGAGPDCSPAGTACAAGLTCLNSACVCPTGLLLCDGTCIDPETDNLWCGATGNCQGVNQGQICQSGHICTGGNCDVTCAPTQALCGGVVNGTCIDPETSPLYCGATVGSCANPGEDCTSTAQGFGPGWVCSGGPSPLCILSCQAGLVDCSGAATGNVQTCIDPMTDPSFCGATANPGDGGVGSATSCGQGFTSAGDNCAEAPYGPGFSCVGGKCQT